MATGTEIPVTVDNDARQWIADKGLGREFETMLEYTKQTALGLRGITVSLEQDPSGLLPPKVMIWPHRDDPGVADDPTDRQWRRWKAENFSPEVCLSIGIISIYGAPADGR